MTRRPFARLGVCTCVGSLMLALLATSCLPAASSVVIAQSSLPRATSPEVDATAIGETAQGINAFGLDLYRVLAGDEPETNVFFSPYSLSTALAMVYAGARGETEAQMAATLHYSLPQEQLHPALNALDLALMAPDQFFTLTTANSAWGQLDYKFLPAYLDVLAVNYGIGMRQVDFIDGAAREAARIAINDWAKERTNGKIPTLITPDLLSDRTRLVLTNAIYFKGDWARPFAAAQTESRPFTRGDGSPVTVQMMRQRGTIAYAAGPDYQAIELPYKGERIRMVGILPAEGQLAEFERSLDAARLTAILQALEALDVALYLPKFEFETGYELEKTLPELGMPDLFDPGMADLSGMYEPDELRLFLAHAIHKAFVAVDEEGTEAAAASAAIAEIVSMPLSVVFDRPFVFLIRDADTGVILFLGRLSDPQAA